MVVGTIIKTQPGTLVNTYKERKRRNVGFLDEVLSEYIRECERAGHQKETHEMGFRWGSSYTAGIIYHMADRPPALTLINNSMKLLWRSMDLLVDCGLAEEGRLLRFHTQGECFTRSIGENHFTRGLYRGVFSTLYGRELEGTDFSQNKNGSVYVYRISESPFTARCKDSMEYYRLNEAPEGATYGMEEAKREGIIKADSNRLSFGGKHLQLIEGTLFHSVSNAGVNLGYVAGLTSAYLKGSLPSSLEASCLLLKKFLESCGWGSIGIEVSKKEIAARISCPPYGFQPEEDNWGYLVYTMLGFLQASSPTVRLQRNPGITTQRTLAVGFAVD